MYLFFDTETTGIPKNYKAPATDTKNWPRLVEIAWLVTDSSGKEIFCAEHIIKPDGFIIADEAAKIHGITQEIACQKGVELKPVLDQVAADIGKVDALLAHNIQFDEKILGAEFIRMGQRNFIEGKLKKCTMQSSTNYCKIPGPYGNKWPKLQELYYKLFNQNFDNAHSALADVQACARCYFELRRLGVMD
ncbi:MAG: 3'-5' exonuclease [Gallionellaceae bacterium]